MPDTPEFKFKLEIHTKGGTKHLLAVAALLLVLSIPLFPIPSTCISADG